MSHVNSTPRALLGGKSPIEMMRFIYEDKDTQVLLDALGIREMLKEELMLKPEHLQQRRACFCGKNV